MGQLTGTSAKQSLKALIYEFSSLDDHFLAVAKTKRTKAELYKNILLAGLEVDAQQQDRGVFHTPNAVRPWDYRRSQ
jgi:hypothetical protein